MLITMPQSSGTEPEGFGRQGEIETPVLAPNSPHLMCLFSFFRLRLFPSIVLIIALQGKKNTMTGAEQQREKDKVAAIMLQKQQAGEFRVLPCFDLLANLVIYFVHPPELCSSLHESA